jgi:hypothetical protein
MEIRSQRAGRFMELRIMEQDRGRILALVGLGVSNRVQRRAGSVQENGPADLAACARLT